MPYGIIEGEASGEPQQQGMPVSNCVELLRSLRQCRLPIDLRKRVDQEERRLLEQLKALKQEQKARESLELGMR